MSEILQAPSLFGQKSLFEDNPIVHRCIVCGRPLKTRRSIEAFAGQTCINKSRAAYFQARKKRDRGKP